MTLVESAISNSQKNLCISHVIDALSEGLTHFSGPSRVALLYAETVHDPIRIYDPQDLLRGHEPKLQELYLQSSGWREKIFSPDDIKVCGLVYPEKNLQLAGLISYGGRTRSVSYQMWFTEHHPNMCSIGPTERWLEHATCLLSHDFANEDAFYTGASRYVVREYATHAVRDCIRDELNIMFGWDTQLEVYTILDTVLGISKTPEEGAWPRGTLVFVDPDSLPEIDFLIRFPFYERMKLKNLKHVRKLMLTVERSTRSLVSDGTSIIGVAEGASGLPACRVTADYVGGHGFLSLAGKPVCSFSDGRFHSSNRKPNLVQFEEAILESRLDSSQSYNLYKIVTDIVVNAGVRKHGASIVIDFGDSPMQLAGQKLEKPLDLQQPRLMDLTKSLAKVDGALHIGADLHLHGFACLLDGHSVPGEDRARGARFNSALRFTAEHPQTIVVVVSSDRPVSVMQGGMELTAQCEWKPFTGCATSPPTLEEWVRAQG